MADPPGAVHHDELHLAIRFATALPDLHLTIEAASRTSVVALKGRIRARLSADLQTRRVRLIHAGKILVDGLTVRHALGLSYLPPPRPPLRLPPAPAGAAGDGGGGLPEDEDGDGINAGAGDGEDDADDDDERKSQRRKDKGKAPMRDQAPQEHEYVYIHCSIGDVLSAEELDREATAAASESLDVSSSAQADRQAPLPTTTTSNAPRGFDRLLGAGFTPAEIAALRAQFLRLQAYTHTPDTMPTAAELRLLEDRWIDDSSASDGTDDGGGGGAGVLGAGAAGAGSGLDDMLWGNVLGFFWPLGAMVWLLREEGIWSSRRQMAVFTGVLLNVAFSVLRVAT